MTKFLYNTVTEAVSRYPRHDDEPIIGLDPAFAVLTEVQEDQPVYDAEAEYLEATRTIDVVAGTLTRGWTIQQRPPAPPEARWQEFGAALAADASTNTMIGTAAQAAPVLHLMLGVGLGQAAQGDARTFSTAWTAAIGAGLVNATLAEHVAGLATTYDLPAEFIAGLNPPAP